jgi:hypothetical protein
VIRAAFLDEKNKLAELDSLNNAAQKRIKKHISRVIKDYLKGIITAEKLPFKAELEMFFNSATLPNIDTKLVTDTEHVIASAMLLGMVHAHKSIDAADTDIPPIAFDTAAQFLKSKIPMTKQEWNALEPKLRFRAFTVARLAELDWKDGYIPRPLGRKSNRYWARS